jgi:predicted nucleotide-binding protein|nr:nucleotide-binding protein [Mucilaginibacter sp. L294]
MAKFYGDISKLKLHFTEHGINGRWSSGNGIEKLQTSDGAVLLWYPNTGTLLSQGKGPSKRKIEDVIKEFDAVAIAVEAVPEKAEAKNPGLFVVYGHDETSRDQLELILGKLGIEPFILAKSSGQGMTIIEALEEQVGLNGSASVGIVLLTPDDRGYSKKEGEEAIKDRARQNVILEMGMLISKLGRSNTIILVKGSLERPSDTDGIIYLSYQKHIKETVGKLVDRLENSGFKINHKKALEAAQ